MASRKKMYDTNRRVRNYLLDEEHCTDVWMKKHTRRLDRTHTPEGFYFSRDLFNLFDGIALNNSVIMFQARTTNFPYGRENEKFNSFAVKYPEVHVVAYVTKKVKNRIQVVKRVYPN